MRRPEVNFKCLPQHLLHSLRFPMKLGVKSTCLAHTTPNTGLQMNTTCTLRCVCGFWRSYLRYPCFPKNTTLIVSSQSFVLVYMTGAHVSNHAHMYTHIHIHTQNKLCSQVYEQSPPPAKDGWPWDSDSPASVFQNTSSTQMEPLVIRKEWFQIVLMLSACNLSYSEGLDGRITSSRTVY